MKQLVLRRMFVAESSAARRGILCWSIGVDGATTLFPARVLAVHLVMPHKKAEKSYKVTARDKRVYSGIRLVDLKKRNPALPPIYRYVAGVHPLRRNTSGSCTGGNTYIYLVDPSDAGRAAFQSLASGISVPGGMINQPGGNPGV